MPLVKPAVVQTIELVTPIVAKQFLRSNENNRTIRPTAVSQYSEKMLQGSWRLSTDAIGFDENGVLINGTAQAARCCQVWRGQLFRRHAKYAS